APPAPRSHANALWVWLFGLLGLGLLIYFIAQPFSLEQDGPPKKKPDGDSAVKKDKADTVQPPPRKEPGPQKLPPDALAEVRRFTGHTDEVLCVALSPDGRYALSGGKDRSVRLWDVPTGKELKRFDGHREAVWCVAFSPSGRRALSGGDDRTVLLWDLR